MEGSPFRPPQGYPPQGYPPPQQGGYPPSGYPPSGYPPPQGYPPQSGGYPPPSQGYPPPQGYPPQSGGYPPPQQQQQQQQQNTLVGITCNNFYKLWDNTKMKKKQKSVVSFFRVETPEGYYRLGDFAEATPGSCPSGSVLVVKESQPNSQLPLLAPPLRYVTVWDDHGTGSKFGDLKILRPVAPAGYVALGDVAWPSHQNDPPLDYMRCVHSSACVQGKWLEPNLWNDIGAGAKNGDVAIWVPVPDPSAGGSAINTFVSTSNYQPPKPNERPAYVLMGPRH